MSFKNKRFKENTIKMTDKINLIIIINANNVNNIWIDICIFFLRISISKRKYILIINPPVLTDLVIKAWKVRKFLYVKIY